MVIIVVSLPCTAYLCGALIALPGFQAKGQSCIEIHIKPIKKPLWLAAQLIARQTYYSELPGW